MEQQEQSDCQNCHFENVSENGTREGVERPEEVEVEYFNESARYVPDRNDQGSNCRGAHGREARSFV